VVADRTVVSGPHQLQEWAVIDGVRYPLRDVKARREFGRPSPVVTSLAELLAIPTCPPDGTVLVEQNGSNVYIIQHGLKLWIPSPEKFERRTAVRSCRERAGRCTCRVSVWREVATRCTRAHRHSHWAMAAPPGSQPPCAARNAVARERHRRIRTRSGIGHGWDAAATRRLNYGDQSIA
jgi:hypothetical protein